MTLQQQIDAFLNGSPFAVAGASADRSKYGNKVFRCYLQHNRTAYPVNPSASDVEGHRAFATLADIQSFTKAPIHAVSIITPYPVTERLIEHMGTLGIKHVWMQPGAESPKAVARATDLGMNVIANGPCLLVVLGFQDH